LKLQEMLGPPQSWSWRPCVPLKRHSRNTNPVTQRHISKDLDCQWQMFWKSFIQRAECISSHCSLSLSIFDRATDLQWRLHCTDVRKQLSRCYHVAPTELQQSSLHNIQIDIVHISEISLCKVKECLSSANPKTLPQGNWFVVRKVIARCCCCFRKLSLDLVPRVGAHMVDPDTMSVVELYHVVSWYINIPNSSSIWSETRNKFWML
jgi:hypothetical protein